MKNKKLGDMYDGYTNYLGMLHQHEKNGSKTQFRGLLNTLTDHALILLVDESLITYTYYRVELFEEILKRMK